MTDIMRDPRTDPVKGSFPIMQGGSLRSIPWAMIAGHEAQAQQNHQQTLGELARRSGLSPCEALCVLANVEWPRSWFGGVPKDLQLWTDAVLSAWSAQFISQADRIEALEEDLAETRCERDIAVAALRSGADKRDFLLRAFVRKSAALTQARKTLDDIREIAARWQAGDGSGHTAYTISEIQRALAQPHTQGEKNHG